MEQEWLEDADLESQAINNDLENFSIPFGKKVEVSMLDRLSKNEDLVMKLLDSPDLLGALVAFYTERVYNSLRGNTPR
jgi:hypothetical protein